MQGGRSCLWACLGEGDTWRVFSLEGVMRPVLPITGTRGGDPEGPHQLLRPPGLSLCPKDKCPVPAAQVSLRDHLLWAEVLHPFLFSLGHPGLSLVAEIDCRKTLETL